MEWHLENAVHVRKPGFRTLGLALASSFLLAGSFYASSSSGSENTVSKNEVSPSAASRGAGKKRLSPPNHKYKAIIRRTTNGVPHVKAANLASAAFGHGYAQAQDNVCVLAEAIAKARSERAKYFGPGPATQFGVGLNIVNDFSYKAQKIYSGAETEFTALTGESRAMIKGFTDGYNRYVMETDPGDLPEECRNQEWVKAITPDIVAFIRCK